MADSLSDERQGSCPPPPPNRATDDPDHTDRVIEQDKALVRAIESLGTIEHLGLLDPVTQIDVHSPVYDVGAKSQHIVDTFREGF